MEKQIARHGKNFEDIVNDAAEYIASRAHSEESPLHALQRMIVAHYDVNEDTPEEMAAFAFRNKSYVASDKLYDAVKAKIASRRS